MIELPTERQVVTDVDAGLTLLYGLPKVGKTTLTAALPNSLHLNLEKNGTRFTDAISYDINSLNDILEVNKALKSGKYNYDFVIIDTVTVLEELCLPLAAQKYKATSMGKNWSGSDVRTLPSGGGYLYWRKALNEVIDVILTWAPHIILIGHLKEKLIEKKGTEISVAEIDLTGKNKSILSARADAIGYVYRKENKTLISFDNSTDDIICGSRIKHIANKIFEVAVSDDKDNLTIDWSGIYTFLK